MRTGNSIETKLKIFRRALEQFAGSWNSNDAEAAGQMLNCRQAAADPKRTAATNARFESNSFVT
jgi:hypothetical protein